MAACGAFVVALAVAYSLVGLSLTPDRFLLVLLVPAIVIGRPWRFISDFLPFALLIVTYSALRGYAHVLHPDPYVMPQLDLERWLFAGHVPAAELQQHLWNGTIGPLEQVVLFVHRIHGMVPMTVAFGLWLVRRALFYRFAATFLALSFAAAATFYLFPSAPPWAAGERGLLAVEKIQHGVPAVTSSAPTNGGTGLYDLIHQNPYAAIPSLHAGYSFLVALFLGMLAWRGGRRWLLPILALYPLAQGLVVIYTGNHYVVDLLIGYAFVLAAYLTVDAVWRRYRLPR